MANAISALIGIMLAVVIGVAVTIPVVVQSIADANLTGTTATIVNLIPLLIGVLLIVIVVGAMGLRAMD
jgi:hypothetical protein